MNLMLTLFIVTALIAVMMSLRTFTDRRSMRQKAGCDFKKGVGSIFCQTGDGDICPKGTGNVFCQERGGDIVDIKVENGSDPFLDPFLN